MDGTASLRHQLLSDSLSRHPLMYQLTMGWFLAHTSQAMTPGQSVTSEENSSHRSARGPSRSMCPSSPKFPVCQTEPVHPPVARQTQVSALLSCRIPCSAHGDFPAIWAGTRKCPKVITSQQPLFRCSGRQPLMLCPETRDLALARG